MLHVFLIPLLCGFLVGVNPFVAPQLHARLQEQNNARRVQAESALITLGIMTLLTGLAWRFGGFISGRLTNSLLFLGLFALAGAFYSLKPFRRRALDEPARGWRWLTRHASDVLYYAGPAWIVATAIAMKQLTFGRFLLAYVAAAAGIILAILLWTTRYASALPQGPAQPGEARSRSLVALSLMYGASALLMFAANLKLI